MSVDEEHEIENTNESTQYSEYETKSQILYPPGHITLDGNIKVTGRECYPEEAWNYSSFVTLILK